MATLVVYPNDATSIDGYVSASGTNNTWANLRAGTGTSQAASTSAIWLYIYIESGTSTWNALYRSVLLFDTSAITASATITAAVMSVFHNTKADGLSISPTVDVYTSTPASNTALAGTDWGNFGTTSQTGSPVAYSSVPTNGYVDFTFSATGRGNVSQTGISKFALRNANYDVAGTTPTWSSEAVSVFNFYSSNQTGTSNDPYLTVTYTLPGPAGVKTVNGIALASCKTWNGISMSSIKTIP